MKILAKVDKGLDVTDQLEYIKESYKDVTDVEWETKEVDGSQLSWEIYYGDSKGVAKSHISNVCAKEFDRREYEIDHVIWFVKRENWEADGIGGWNLGRLYSNYAVQIVLAEQSGKWAGKTLGMEILHAMDELAPVEIGVNLDKYKQIDGEYLDWDNDIVHGEHPYYGVKNGDGYFTDYDYTKQIEEFAPVVSAIYNKRRTKEKKARIELLERVVELLRRLFTLKKKAATPAPLEGHHHHS